MTQKLTNTKAHEYALQTQVVLFCNGDNCKDLSAILDQVGTVDSFEFVRVDCATSHNIEVTLPLSRIW